MFSFWNLPKRCCAGISRLNGHLSETIKSRILSLLWVGLLSVGMIRFLFPPEAQYYIQVLGGVLFSGLIVLLTLEAQKLSSLRIRRLPLALIEGIGLLFLLNAVFYRILAYFAIGLVLCVGLPALYLSLSSFGLKKSILAIARGTVFGYVIVLAITILFCPPLGRRGLSSFFGNTNLFANFLNVSAGSLLVLLHEENESGKRRTGLLVLLFSAITACVLTRSRTNLLAVLMQLGVYLLARLSCSEWKKNIRSFLLGAAKKALLFVLVSVLTFAAVGPGKYFVTLSALRVFMPSVLEQMEADGISSYDILNSTVSYLFKGLETKDRDKPGLESGDEIGEQEDVFTSGRKEIWRRFYGELRLAGHPEESMEIVEKTRHYQATNAHNVYLQLAYTAGIPAGLFMLLLMCWTGWRGFGRYFTELRRRKVTSVCLFAVLGWSGFLFPSLTSSGYMLFVYYPATWFWISAAGLCVDFSETYETGGFAS